jgi:hypothetical protein
MRWIKYWKIKRLEKTFSKLELEIQSLDSSNKIALQNFEAQRRILYYEIQRLKNTDEN